MEEVKLDFKKIKRIMRLLYRILEKKYHLYYEPHGMFCDSYVVIECISPYFNGSRRCFRNIPRSEKEWKTLERYAMLRHILYDCPYPYKCPTMKKIIQIYPSIVKT